jgi:uridine kinase
LTAQPYLIAIAGPSASGKSCIAALVAETLGAERVDLDSYYRDLSHLPVKDRELVNFDDPASLDETLLIEQVGRLAAGHTVAVPVYDFAAHNRSGRAREVKPAPFVIIEGIFALYWPELRDLCRLRVYVDLDHANCRERRIARDVRERGRSAEEVRHRYDSQVQPMCDRFVAPTRQYADLVLEGAAPPDASTAILLRRIAVAAVRGAA